MSCGHDVHERPARDAAIGVVATRKRVTLLGSRFVFADDWNRWNRWENYGAGINFAPMEAMEFSAVQVPADCPAAPARPCATGSRGSCPSQADLRSMRKADHGGAGVVLAMKRRAAVVIVGALALAGCSSSSYDPLTLTEQRTIARMISSQCHPLNCQTPAVAIVHADTREAAHYAADLAVAFDLAFWPKPTVAMSTRFLGDGVHFVYCEGAASARMAAALGVLLDRMRIQPSDAPASQCVDGDRWTFWIGPPA